MPEIRSAYSNMRQHSSDLCCYATGDEAIHVFGPTRGDCASV